MTNPSLILPQAPAYDEGFVYAAEVYDGSTPIYNVLPLNFTRSNDTATRVNSAGLIEKVRTNIVPNGLLFNGSTGVLYTTITSDSPISGLSSMRITKNEAAGTLRYGNQTISASVLNGSISYTISRYFKYDGYNTTTSLEYNNSNQFGGTAWVQNIDIASTGVTLQAPINCTSKVTNVGNGWYRVEVTIVNGASPSGSPVSCLLKVASTLSTGQGFLTAAPQFETGDTATDYIPTTNVAVSVGPVANLPRLNYPINSDGSVGCPSLLLEPQTTALNQFSEQLDNAYWTKSNSTATANQTASPSGYVDAELILDNTSNAQHAISTSIAVTSGNKYTASFFLKAAGYTTSAIRMGVGALWTGGIGPTVEFDLVALTGTVVDGSGVTFTIEDYGNGWRRCSVTGTCVTSGNTAYSLYVKQYNAYIGSGTDGVYAWGANITATDYLQSYIPTLEAAVTRVIERFNKTGISSLINSQEGTFFVEMATFSDNVGTRILSLSDGSVNNNLYIGYTPTTNRISAVFSSGGTAQAALNTTAFNITEQNKIAVSYKTNEFKMYVNGTLIGTDTSVTMPAAGTLSQLKSDFGQGSFPLEASLKQAIIFPTALTDAQLAELTTL